MSARLVARSGPLEGVTIPLPDGECSIGRGENNMLCLATASAYLSLELFNRDYWAKSADENLKTAMEKIRATVRSALA